MRCDLKAVNTGTTKKQKNYPENIYLFPQKIFHIFWGCNQPQAQKTLYIFSKKIVLYFWMEIYSPKPEKHKNPP